MLQPVAPVTAALPELRVDARRIASLRSAGTYGASAAAITATWAAAIWASQHVHPDPVLHDCALFLHLASLVAGMGAVLTLDWFGTRWLLGHHAREDVLRLAGGSHGLIWLGLTGLTVSAIFLEPDLSSSWTQFKLLMVLVVALNGLYAHALQRVLEQTPVIGRRLMMRAAVVALLSQGGWWSAVAIGFYNSRTH